MMYLHIIVYATCTPSKPQPSLDKLFITKETDIDMDTSFICIQQDYTTE